MQSTKSSKTTTKEHSKLLTETKTAIKDWVFKGKDPTEEEYQEYEITEYNIVGFEASQQDMKNKYEMQQDPDKHNKDYFCDKCCDTKETVTKDGYYFNGKPCSCIEERKLLKKRKEQQRRVNDIFKNSQISKTNLDKTFEDFKEVEGKSNAKKAARAYADAFKHMLERGIGLTFQGKVGTGKTMLVEIMAQQIMNEGYTCLVTTAYDLWLEIANTYGTDRDTQDVMDKARKVELLILDNLNSVSKSNFNNDEANKFFNLINYRYNQKLPTVITTTSSLGKLATQLSIDLTDRIDERNKLIRIRGKNMRGAKKKKADQILDSLIKNY